MRPRPGPSARRHPHGPSPSAPRSRSIPWLGAWLLVATTGCGEAADREPAAAAEARSRAIAAAEWHYGQDTVPGDAGSPGPRVVDRCRVTLPAEPDDTLDVACGLLFLGLEPGTDSARIARLADALELEVADRGALPAWTTELGEPLRYVLVRVPARRERRAAERALASDGVRFVDVREVARRRP